MITYVSPQGYLTGFTSLAEPRDYQNDGRFKYQCQLIVNGAEALAFAKEIDTAIQAAVLEANDAKKKKHPKDQPPYTQVVDENGDVIDGELCFRFRVPAKWKDGTSRQPKFYGLDGKEIEVPKKIGPGSKVRVRYAMFPREVGGRIGVTLQPTGIQVIALVEFQGRGGGGGDEGFDSLLPEVNPDAPVPF